MTDPVAASERNRQAEIERLVSRLWGHSHDRSNLYRTLTGEAAKTLTEVLAELSAARATAERLRERERTLAEAHGTLLARCTADLNAMVEWATENSRGFDWPDQVRQWALQRIDDLAAFAAAVPVAHDPQNSEGDPVEVRPPDSRAESQAELNGPSGSPISPSGRVCPPVAHDPPEQEATNA